MQAAAPQQATSQPQGTRMDAGQIAARLVAILTEIIGVTVSREEPLMEVLPYMMPRKGLRCLICASRAIQQCSILLCHHHQTLCAVSC